MKKKELTKSQKKVYDYLKSSIVEGVPPTVREICAATGLSSTSSVHAHLKTLERLGYIYRDRGHRSIKLADNPASIAVPILGRVTAGLPIYAFEDITGYVPFEKSKAAGKELFALRVQGESMRDIGILDNDVVICQKQVTAQNGDIVVALIDDEATVKSFYKENNQFRLQPHNPDFQPIIVDELSIIGKVISLYREL